MLNHLTEETIHAYILRSLEQDEGVAAERHLIACASCREALAAELRYIAAMRRAMRQ